MEKALRISYRHPPSPSYFRKEKIMRLLRHIGREVATTVLAFSLIIMFSSPALTQQKTTTQRRQTTTVRSAYDRGYIAGYTDGYQVGKNDYTSRVERDFQRSGLYQEATRGYETRFGDSADYQDGYRLGFEIAYTDGYFGRTLSSAVPARARALRSAALKSAPTETAKRAPTQTVRQGSNYLVLTGRN
jgi:hypothetical protein